VLIVLLRALGPAVSIPGAGRGADSGEAISSSDMDSGVLVCVGEAIALDEACISKYILGIISSSIQSDRDRRREVHEHYVRNRQSRHSV
jgi:hypothetical protein